MNILFNLNVMFYYIDSPRTTCILNNYFYLVQIIRNRQAIPESKWFSLPNASVVLLSRDVKARHQ